VTGRRLELPLAVALGVLVRVPFWVEALRTPVDGDTAIIGLMARHPTWSATMWGQPYGSPLEPWLTAPLFALLSPDTATLRLAYFLLGLALIPAAYLLARSLDERAALPAAVLMACPSPYFLLIGALPPPMYPSALLLAAAVLALAFRLGERWGQGGPARSGLALWGALAGLALWTHLMTATTVAAGGWWLVRRAAGRRGSLWPAALALAAFSAPWWARALADPKALEMISVSGRRAGLGEHLAATLPRVHEAVGGLLGTHVPLVADAAEHVVHAPGLAAAAVILAYGVAVVLALRRAGRVSPSASPSASASASPSGDEGAERARVLLAAAALALLVFPFPLRSSPSSIRFLTAAYLPVVALVAWVSVAAGGRRRAWTVVLVLATAHAVTSARLLAAWRAADRAAPPFLLVDLQPVRALLDSRRVRHAYASYGPAYRLTFESGERIVASQPWNERFLHYPLPYLDEVRFAKDVAWVLTPDVPTDLPAPRVFEEALSRAGGRWRRADAGRAAVFDGFVPPFAPTVAPLAAAGPGGDGDPATLARPSPTGPTTFTLDTPRALDAVTLFSAASGERLPRSMDVSVSADGLAFETVAQRRRRGEREDLRWVNGHPQYVVDQDLMAIPLGGRTVAAVRIEPVLSTDPWTLSEVLLHPAAAPAARAAWDEWLDPHLSWEERRRALVAQPRTDREDWYYRWGLAARRR
jgi:4-amino-4-deoxy-L-arabinose transferase-like glycosyltransferase